MDPSSPLGATFDAEGEARFLLWAPKARSVTLRLHDPSMELALTRLEDGYFGTTAPGLGPGVRYTYRLDGSTTDLPDPASRSQPDGVLGPSALVAPRRFAWHDTSWTGVPLRELLLYELHVGTFSEEGTFAGVIPELERLRSLGVTAIELLPVAQFPGGRNWGYDGVFPYAVQSTYGGWSGLATLVDAAHGAGLAVVLDVVYNHLGPEGNRLAEFGPYFTDQYKTPWGLALNFDGPESDHVRRFFLESAVALVREAHADGLRVDAVHAIVDPTARPFVTDLTESLHALAPEPPRPVHVIAESDRNDPRTVIPVREGGIGFDAVWADDLHHALHALLTGERAGYYADFGTVHDVARALADPFVYGGQFSRYRRRRHGVPATGLAGPRFVVESQNHDQVGNRAWGDRLATLVSFESLKLAAAVVILSPYLPLLFMGEEYAETAPFLYFTSHGDPALARAVREGRRREFPSAEGRETPDPQAEETFQRSRPQRSRREEPPARAMHAYYQRLLALRRAAAPPRRLRPGEVEVPSADPPVLTWRCEASGRAAVYAIYHFGTGAQRFELDPGFPAELRLDSAATEWAGPGTDLPARLAAGDRVTVGLAPRSAAVYTAGEVEG